MSTFPFDYTNIVANLFSVIGLCVVLVAIYRIAFHPLSYVPGPLLAKVTHAYGVVHVWKRDFHLASMRWHESYGSVVRIAPNRLIFNSATALSDIYTNPQVTKGQAYTQLRHGGKGVPNLLTTQDKEEHRRKRRIVGPVVSERSMRVFETDMMNQVDVFLAQLLHSSKQKDIVNMTPRCERLGVDIVGQLAFGYALKTQTNAEHRLMVEGMKTRSDRSTLYFFWGRLNFLEVFFNLYEGTRNLEVLYGSIQKMIGARMAKPKDALHDFYAMTSKDIAPGEPGMVGKELWAEAVFFVAAGGSTTATAMSGVFFYLSRNQGAYGRLASEIRTTFSSASDIRQGHLLNSCKYLRAVIDETMRMSPSTLPPGWREQDPSSIARGEQFIVDGHVIPFGTQVAVSHYTLHRNPKYFPDPHKFLPERWLLPTDTAAETDEDSERRKTMKRSFVPFSIGDRSCAGKPMAYLEMSLTIAKTLWYFDFEKAPGEAGKLGEGDPSRKDGRGRVSDFQLYDSIVVDHDGPNLIFTPRDDHWKEIEADVE